MLLESYIIYFLYFMISVAQLCRYMYLKVQKKIYTLSTWPDLDMRMRCHCRRYKDRSIVTLRLGGN
jgi:hypothetical protein